MTTDKLEKNFSSTTLDLINDIYKKFAEKSPDVFWVLSPSMTDHIYVSPAYETVWGRDLESLLGKVDDWISTILPEDRERLLHDNKMGQLIAEGSDAKYFLDYRIQRPDGSVRWIHDQSFPIYDSVGECVAIAGIARDVTDDVMQKKEIEKAKEVAESANKAKADFLASMSHELRTPLNAIIGLSEIIQMKELPADIAEYINVIEDSGMHLLNLINDILDFAKIEEGKLSLEYESFNLIELTQSILHTFYTKAKEQGLILQFDYDAELPKIVIADPKRLRQVLTNLISNALKFTAEGSVTVKLACLKKGDRKASYLIEVTDTGIGIAEDDMEKLFTRFSQLQSGKAMHHGGTGLGLAITKELVEMMGGRITVTSECGVGTTFSCQLEFPIKRKSVQEQTTVSRSLYAKLAHSHILVVEDNLINQRIIKILLSEFGCKVDIASDAHLALEKDMSKYQLVLMDVGLPDISGIELARMVREREGSGSRIPIIAVTAHALATERERCFAAGMDDILVKPVLFDQLRVVLSRWIT